MNKFIPYEKLSKKAKKKIDQLKRKSWNGLDPSTRIVPDKKKYSRKNKHLHDYNE